MKNQRRGLDTYTMLLPNCLICPVPRKLVCITYDQVRHKQVCTATESNQMFEIRIMFSQYAANLMVHFLAHLGRRLIGTHVPVSVRCCPSSSSIMLKPLLLPNRWANQSQISCGASLGRGNESLFEASGSHDQDGRHAHI